MNENIQFPNITSPNLRNIRLNLYNGKYFTKLWSKLFHIQSFFSQYSLIFNIHSSDIFCIKVCSVVKHLAPLPRGYSGFKVTGRYEGFFLVGNPRFWDFLGKKSIFFGSLILVGIFLGKKFTVKKMLPYLLLQICSALRLVVKAWDFVGFNFGSGDCFGFRFKPQGFF